MPQDIIDAALGPRELGPYQVGPGDTLLVVVYGHPELSVAGYGGGNLAGGGVGNRLSGLVIDNDGTIQFPLVGSVNVKGQTLAELRVFLEERLAAYIKDPHVMVQVAYAGSIRYYMLGQFVSPGLKQTDRPLRLLEAISLAGGIHLERSSLRSAYLARDGKHLPINFRRLLREGDVTQNIPLQTGDVVFIPDNLSERAFVFGGSSNGGVNGGPVPFASGRLTLLQALAAAGFGFRDRALGKMSKTRVIRSEGGQATLFVVNASKIVAGEAAPFELEPGDIVYVPMTAVTGFNEAIAQLLPTLRVVSGVLQPFVQIKYLSE